MRRVIRSAVTPLMTSGLLLLASMLSGCGTGVPTSAVGLATLGSLTNGRVMGGQQLVAGAHVYLFGASGNGPGGAARSLLGTRDGSSANVSNVAFDNPAGSGNDGLGTYVLTDANGNFTVNGSMTYNGTLLPSTYVCGSDAAVYALVVGGNPGLAVGTNNASLELMADLGPCGVASAGTTLPAGETMVVNEVSTVAAVYALAGYMTGPTGLSYDGTALGLTGFENASANVGQLISVNSGFALTTTPNGKGTVPVGMINTLANIVAACVNSDGSTVASGAGQPVCGMLFQNATSNGVSGGGTVPTETLTALLNIAHHPGANVSALYKLQTAAAPFVGLATQPNDFTLGVSFGGNGLNSPGIPAVDGSGNVWFGSTLATPGVTPASYTVVELTPQGGVAGSVASAHPVNQAAVDPSGNAWFAATNGGAVLKVAAGSVQRTAYNVHGVTNDDVHQLAIDGAGMCL